MAVDTSNERQIFGWAWRAVITFFFDNEYLRCLITLHDVELPTVAEYCSSYNSEVAVVDACTSRSYRYGIRL